MSTVASNRVDTIILVDVDGVLNVGVRDSGEAPLLFNRPNMGYANGMRGRKAACQADQDSVDKLLSVSEQVLGDDEEGGTYTKFMCGESSHISEVLAERLAMIIEKAGDNHAVILSSNWRKPHHRNRVRKLEEEVATHLGKVWAFDGTTQQADEKRAADRLRCIGEYVKAQCEARVDDSIGSARESSLPMGKQLRIILLEDFFITPLNGWFCDGVRIGSAADAETYLKQFVPADMDVAIKLVHTYDEWATESGLRVQVGAGLGMKHVLEAQAFLNRAQTAPATSSAHDLAGMVIKDHVKQGHMRDSVVATELCAQALMTTMGDKDKAIMDAGWLSKSIATWPWFSMYLRCATV